MRCANAAEKSGPDATAVASIEIWNNVMKSWVNRSARGIPLLNDGGDGLRLRYVFDVKDTNGREMPRAVADETGV